MKREKTVKEKTVKVCQAYIFDGLIKHSFFNLITENINILFDDLIYDAQKLADNLNGKIYYQRDEKSLYISYLDIPETSKIDVIYKIL